MGGLSSPEGLLQASHMIHLPPALKASKLECLCPLKQPREEAIIFQVVYTSHLPQNPARLHGPAASCVWIPCLRVREQRAAAVLCVCLGIQCPSPQVVTQLSPLQLLQGPGHQLQLLGIGWLEWAWLTFCKGCQETLHMGPCPTITECHVCVSFVGRVN